MHPTALELKMAMPCLVWLWITFLSVQFLFLSLITVAVQPIPPFRRGSGQAATYPYYRALEGEVDGVAACKNCKSSAGRQCVGRTISDENCDNCSKGQTFWPCNLKKECWCWDTSLPRDPGDEDDAGRACSGCGRGGAAEVCASNQNSLVPVGDEECAKCMEGQSFWPCDDPDLCWCWDTTKPKKPPAPASGLAAATELDPDVSGPCEVLTREAFRKLAPNSTFPYTYEGLCNAIDDYNLHHTEKFAAMGTLAHITGELAAFLGNTAHESDDFEAAREYLACGDRKEVDGKVYCKPCNNDQYDWPKNICGASMVDKNAPYNSYCQPSFEPPEGCVCDTITQVEESGPLAGYVEASKVFYGRGAIQLSWNYNYIRASYALTGSADTFCDDPEQVATTPEYAWGTGIYFWMEEGSTCHKEALKGDFGGTLNNINGGLECPAYKGGWHADAIKMRLNRYCHAAWELGMDSIASREGCRGMEESFEECLQDGHCPYCERYAPGKSTDIEIPEPEPVPVPVPMPEEVLLVSPAPVPLPTPAPATSQPTKAPTLAPTLPKAATAPPTITFILPTYKPTPPPSDEVETLSPTTSEPSLSPTLAPATGEPSKSPMAAPTQQPTSADPTYSPSTPQPTMGPCDGDPCPGEYCRSAYGFCGFGDAYCSELAIWSPECREDSDPPTPSPTEGSTEGPTGSPEERANPITRSPIGSVGAGAGAVMTRSPIALAWPGSTSFTGIPTKKPTASSKGGTAGVVMTRSPIGSTKPWPGAVSFTDKPTKKPAAKEETFTKPSGGKKPSGGGKPKPSSSGSNNSSQMNSTTQKEQSMVSDSTLQTANTAQNQKTATHMPTQQPTSTPIREPITPSPTLKPTENDGSNLTPDIGERVPIYPETTFFCGTDWEQANLGCNIRCPSSKSSDCPINQMCFAFTSCLDVGVPEFNTPTEQPINPPFTFASVTLTPVTAPVTAPSPAPTTGAGISEFTFASMTPAPVNAPVTAPVTPATSPALMAGAGISERKGCSGTPCPFVGECRSQYGFCGTNFIYCNALSSWTLDDCGLVGPMVPGEAVAVCDTEVLQCPEGGGVYKNPENDCKFFPCPADDDEEGEIASAVFHVPAPSPKFPQLPGPTLPIIDKPRPFMLPTIAKPLSGTINLGKKPSGSKDVTLVVIDTNHGVEDDKEQTSEEEDTQKPSNSEDEWAQFTTGDWKMNNTSARHSLGTFIWAMLAVALILAMVRF